MGFDGNTCAVVTALDEQSPDIAMGVEQALEVKENGLSEDEKMETGAGDQGMMYGYATNETEELMPYPITLAHKLAYRLSEVRKQGILNYLRPDGKTQVTVEYDENDIPVRLENVVLSTQHNSDISQDKIFSDIKKICFLMLFLIQKWLMKTRNFMLINGTLRCRRTAWGQWSNRAQDYCRYLWWLRTSWWRCLFWQRLYKGRPFRSICS